MKKMLSIFFALSMVLAFNSEAYAATSASATLYASETSKSTIRIDARQHATYNVANTGKYSISYRVFKNGVAVTGYKFVSPGQRASGKQLTGGTSAQYSVRMYCESSSGTGCTGNSGIVGF
ncbi:hypothetical protein [Bhargavaea cecembensis]|uniref:hypothetical protein n=1 Tax=Bhargavaea cecembensis TaxID=394098 RepID=UPI0012688BD6|nr:hypothetical protein [Bhargavaea cecembensis]